MTMTMTMIMTNHLKGVSAGSSKKEKPENIHQMSKTQTEVIKA